MNSFPGLTRSQINALIAAYAAPISHNHDDRYYTETEIDVALAGKSDVGHNHDDRYYTEIEIGTLLMGYALVAHTHAATDITSGALALARGGTGVDLSAGGGATHVLAQDAAHVISARALIAADIPSLDASKISSGALALARGGTGTDLSASGGARQVLVQDAAHAISARLLVTDDLRPAISNLLQTASTTLSGSHDASTTTINVASTTGFPSQGTLIIDSEYITYTGISGNSFTGCSRGQFNIAAASHSNGATVRYMVILVAASTSSTPSFVLASDGKFGGGFGVPPSAAAGGRSMEVSNGRIGSININGAQIYGGSSSASTAPSLFMQGAVTDTLKLETFTNTSADPNVVINARPSAAQTLFQLKKSGTAMFSILTDGDLDINADTIRLRTSRTPASAAATGSAGEICWDGSYLYVCVASNTWVRAALATW